MVALLAAGLGLSAPGADGQLITRVDGIPNTGKPPVVFLNGYQITCDNGVTFDATFDDADELLRSDGRVSLFFNNCAIPGKPPIEELGNELGKFLRSLRYENGQAVPQVDIVAHSMGGLIVRSYLAGKQTQEGLFTPPAETLIRKAVFLGTPHFGSPVTALLAGTGGGDRQTAQLQSGSPFLFDLATWNQGGDDLRGVDAISVVGNTANGFGGLMQARTGDGVTTMVSGSLRFVSSDRTRVVPYCHTNGFAALLCSNSRGFLAQLDSAQHDTARILLSFLNNTSDWRSIGQSAEQETFLSQRGGILARYKDANDRVQEIQRATALGELNLLQQSSKLLFSEYLPTGEPLSINLTFAGGTANLSVPLIAGTVRAATIKPGPFVNAIIPSPAALLPRSVAPGSLISLYGNALTTPSGDTEVLVAGQRTAVSYAGATQINTIVPENAVPENTSGLIKVQVKNSAGEHTLNLLVEPVAPAVFAPATNAVSGTVVTTESPLRPGDYVALYATGLGATRPEGGLQWSVVRPEVVFGGQPCVVSYAGRAPGYIGLDQINCQIAANAQLSDTAPVIVRSGNRTSNVITLPLR